MTRELTNDDENSFIQWPYNRMANGSPISPDGISINVETSPCLSEETVEMTYKDRIPTTTLEEETYVETPLNVIQEVKLWYELHIDLRRKLQTKIDDYVDNFTIHGLSKVFRGNRIESFFWFLMLVSGITLCLLVLNGLISKYVRRAVYTEITSQITDQNYFPAITICEKKLLVDAYYAYCNEALRFQATRQRNYPCEHSPKVVKENVTTTDTYWTNGIFNVTHCQTWGLKNCRNDKYWKTLTKLNNSCITWNHRGDLFDLHSLTDIRFRFISPDHLGTDPQIIAIPHDPRLEEIDLTGKIDITPDKRYMVKLDKTIIRRLPAPYPSNCSDENSGSIFRGGYSRYACLESYNYINMLKACGDTPDYVRSNIPEHILEKYKQNRTMADTIRCMMSFSRMESQDSQACRFPCEEWDLTTISSVQNSEYINTENTSVYDITVSYQNVDTYRIMQEKELFTWDQMVCEIGGFIGIIIGMSVMSLIEVIVYVFLVIARRLV